MPTMQARETVKVHLILSDEAKQKRRDAIKSYRRNVGGAIFLGAVSLLSVMCLAAGITGVIEAQPWQFISHLAGSLLVIPGMISCVQKARDLQRWLDRWS